MRSSTYNKTSKSNDLLSFKRSLLLKEPALPQKSQIRVCEVFAKLVRDDYDSYILYTIKFWIVNEGCRTFRCIITSLVLREYFAQFSFIFPSEIIYHILCFLNRLLPEDMEYFTLEDRFSNLNQIAEIVSERVELKAPFPSKSWFPGSTTSDVEVKERIILLRNYFQEAVSSPDLLTFTKFCLEITSRDKGLSNILEGIGKNLKYQREFPNLYRFYRSSQKYHLAQTFFREFRGLAYPEQMKFLVNKNCSARTFGGEEEIKEATSNWTYFHLKDASSLLGYDFVLSTFESLDTALYYIKKEDIGLLQRPKHHIYRATHVKNKPEIERLLYIEIQRNRLSDDETFIYMNEQFNTPQIHVEGNWPLIKIYEGKSLRLSTKELGEFLIGPVEITITSHSDICFFLTVACLMKKLRPLHLNTPFKTSVSDGFSSHDISI